MPVYEEKNLVNGQKRWFIRTYITDEYGKRKQITKHNKDWLGRDGKKEAECEEKRLQNKKFNRYEHITLGETVDKYVLELEKVSKESTVYGHTSVIKSNIIPFFSKNSQIYDLDEQDIIKWHEWLNNKNYSIEYKNKCNTVMSSIIKTAIKFFKLRINVVEIVGNFKETQENKEKIIQNKLKYITFEEFQTFITAVNDPLWYTFFNVLYYTGMRKGELQALTWNDIDFKRKEILITKTLTIKTRTARWKVTSTKNLKNRKIDMDDNLIEILNKYYTLKKENKNFNNNHFVFGDTEPLKEHKIDLNKDKYFAISNVRRITIHEFRHSHVSFLINEYLKGKQTDTKKFFIMTSARLGHTIEVMQNTYLHLFDDIQSEIVELINNKQQDQKQDQKIKKAFKIKA